jgi:hypothetical protein
MHDLKKISPLANHWNWFMSTTERGKLLKIAGEQDFWKYRVFASLPYRMRIDLEFVALREKII